jgi:hypothetical protein
MTFVEALYAADEEAFYAADEEALYAADEEAFDDPPKTPT